MNRKQKPPEPRGESRFTPHREQNQTVVRLARGNHDTEQRREALRAFFGDLADDKLEEQVTKLQEHEDTILAWLSEQPEALAAFVEDPLDALRKQFPALELPTGRKGYIPSRVRVEVQPIDHTDPVVLEIFQKLWEYVAASKANAHTFETVPFSVIASVGAAYPRDKVDQVVRAFEAVFGIYRLAITAGVLDLAFAHARRP
jgi:hypothetical protein